MQDTWWQAVTEALHCYRTVQLSIITVPQGNHNQLWQDGVSPVHTRNSPTRISVETSYISLKVIQIQLSDLFHPPCKPTKMTRAHYGLKLTRKLGPNQRYCNCCGLQLLKSYASLSSSTDHYHPDHDHGSFHSHGSNNPFSVVILIIKNRLVMH